MIVDGYYGSGKTTFCKDFRSKNKSYKYLAIDRLCSRFRGDYASIYKEVIKIVLDAAKSDTNLIIDFYFKPGWKTLLNNITDVDYIKSMSNNSIVTVEYVKMTTSLEESYERYKNRYRDTIGVSKISFEDYKKRCGID